jgi:hypothetical protein
MQCNEVFLRSVIQLLVTAKVTSSLIVFTLMMGEKLSSETSVLTGATRLHTPENVIFKCG